MSLTLEQVATMLRVNKHRLDDELEVQPEIMQRIAERVVVHNSRMLEAKDSLARVEARLTEDIKDEDTKQTKDVVEAKVKRHKDRTRAWQDYQEARADYEAWDHALECWRQKGFSLKTLSDLYAAQYFSVSSVSSVTPAAREERRLEARKAMRDAAPTTPARTRRTLL